MKPQRTITALAMLACFTLLAACSKPSRETTTDTDTVTVAEAPKDSVATGAEPQFAVDAAFQQQLAAVFNAYLRVKDAFVASNASTVKKETTGLHEALSHTDMKLLNGAAHHDWMSYQSSLESSIRQIEGTSDLETQRKAFQGLSENLYKSIKAYGLTGDTVYYAYCPMAFNNAGASWLSNAKQIRNPYFGDAMLTCGSVKEVLR